MLNNNLIAVKHMLSKTVLILRRKNSFGIYVYLLAKNSFKQHICIIYVYPLRKYTGVTIIHLAASVGLPFAC